MKDVSITHLYDKINYKEGNIYPVNVSIYYSSLIYCEVLVYFIIAFLFWPFIVIYLY